MKILLDTHILLWTLTNDTRLPKEATALIENEQNEIFYSIVSVWEVEIKNSIGKMPISGKEFSKYCKESGFEILHLEEEHIFMLNTLIKFKDAPKHNDPFDRIMIAQAKSEKMIFITHDSLIPYYNESCIVKV